jgi:hypothetical protein
MSEPDGRYDAPHGSTAASGSALPGDQPPGQPLAEQPTEVIRPVGPDPGYDTLVGTAPVYPTPRTEDDATTDPGLQLPFDDRRDDSPVGIGEWEDDGTATQPDYRDTPVVVRRADNLAGLLLLLAGIAAGVSLLLVWLHGGATGLNLVRNGVDDLGHPQRLADRDTWEPLAVVLGGAALFLLGLLMYVPAKTHRFLGALALLATLVVAAGVLVPLANAHWDVQRWAVGAWFAVGVAGLGFLGAIKALMTGPKVGHQH